MTIEKLDILLHDGSQARFSVTDSGAVYLEILAPMNLQDGHGFGIRGSAILTEETLHALQKLLTRPSEREAA